MSPLFFFLDLDLILQEHDVTSDKEVDFDGERVHTLGYAYDATLLNVKLETSTERVTAISQGPKHTVKKVVEVKLSEAQNEETCGQCETTELENVFKFKYLGSIFAVNGNHK